MQIKNSITFYFLFFFLVFNSNLNADEFNITAKEIVIEKDNEIIIGKGNVKAQDKQGRIIYADKITYKKNREFLLAEGNVKIIDLENNVLTSSKATFDKQKEVITTYGNTEFIIEQNYKLKTNNIIYNLSSKIISSKDSSMFTDIDGNRIETSMFQYDINRNLFSSIGEIKVIDVKKNKYFFKEIYIDTKKKEMIGSDVSVALDQKNFGLSKKNDPRFIANEIFVTQNKTELSKGIFTICQKRDDKCPPWSLKAKKITHDNIKKNIYYEHAILKIYDVPIFYFPRFFHPDPTVKRQSGFLFPYYTSSSKSGNAFVLPYYWAINNDKDLTITPKYYSSENPLFLNEYRQAFNNGSLILDTGYTEGYKKTSTTKTAGSKNHIFADLKLNFNNNEEYESKFSLLVSRTSDDDYFKDHKINTQLINSSDTSLVNELKYSFSKDSSYFNIATNMYENIKVNSNKRYEYILPNINFGKTFSSANYGNLDFKSNALYNNYDVNKYKTFLTNDIIWKPADRFTKNGFKNSFEVMLRNNNYETKKTKEYKDGGVVNEMHGVLGYKSSIPMKKDGIKYSNIFTPNFMLRLAPGHMRDLNNKAENFQYSNLYSLNRTSEIEDGLSAVLGFDFKIDEKNKNNKEKATFSLGQVYNYEKNKDIPSQSSLDQKMSDIVGEASYNFSQIGEIDYKFNLDHNLNDLNYNEIASTLNFGLIKFNLDYLEKQNHVGTERYASSGITLNFNENNLLNFTTKKNFETDSSEFHDISYQYAIDCLTAGLVYRREFYEDSAAETDDSLMFTITFVPFGGASLPKINK